MAPGVAAALATTVAGLMVAIPSMFGYNWLVHNLRVATVEMDNFAQELSSKIEAEYLQEVPVNAREPLAVKETAKPQLEPIQTPAPQVKPQPKSKAAEETQVLQESKENDQPDLLPPDTEVES